MGKSYITTFSYDCELAFNTSDGRSIPILKECVSYIIVNSDYAKSVMPVMYMKLRLLPSTYNLMVPQQGKGKIYLKLYRTRTKGSTSSSPKKVIYDEFDYYMTDDPNAYRQLDTTNEEFGTSYKECFIGLIKMDLQKQNQRTFEGIFKNVDSFSLIQSATSHMKMVIQPFNHNKQYSSFVCPPITSVGQFIAYLNQDNSLYNGSYVYFMDNDKTYLRSNDGSYIDAKDGDMKYVAFDIRDLTSYTALTTGMVEDPKQDAYIIYVPGTDAQIIIDRVTSGLVGEVNTISNKDGSKIDAANVNTNKITNISRPGSVVMNISDDPNASQYIATRIAESSDTLIITKIDMDSKIFTPNKQYLLSNYEDNPKYCGVYYLVSKKEIYLRNGNQMSCQMTLTLRKCADFIKDRRR